MKTYSAPPLDLQRAKLPERTRFYYIGEFRPPRAGEFYLSGARPCAYRAHNDLSTAYHIVRPVPGGNS